MVALDIQFMEMTRHGKLSGDKVKMFRIKLHFGESFGEASLTILVLVVFFYFILNLVKASLTIVQRNKLKLSPTNCQEWWLYNELFKLMKANKSKLHMEIWSNTAPVKHMADLVQHVAMTNIHIKLPRRKHLLRTAKPYRTSFFQQHFAGCDLEGYPSLVSNRWSGK